MRKYTLIKFFNGEATEQEIDNIIEWVEKSPDNKRYFAKQKEFYTALLMADIKLNNNPLATDSSENIFSDTADHIGIGGKQSSHFSLNGFTEKRTSHSQIRGLVGKAITIAAACAVFFVAGFFLNKFGGKHINNTAVADLHVVANGGITMHELYTERGVKGFIVLPDSSKVWLNSDSRIIYPEAFSGKSRDIKINGEAYFEVTKDSLHPMIISTGKDFSIEVLGTSFNIKNYDNDEQIETTLYTGVIKAHYKSKGTAQVESLTLKPNESFTFDNTSGSGAGASANNKPFNYEKPEQQSAWKDGSLIFDNTPIPEVIKMLERWHGTTFIVQNEKIYKYKLSAQFSSESIVQILEIMKLIMPIDYSYKNNIVTLQ